MVWGGPYRNFDLSNIFFPPPLYINNDRSLNSSQTDKALSVKTSNADFVIFFAYFGNSLFDYLWNFFVCYGSKPGSHFARNLHEFGVARSEELEVNQWIAVDIPADWVANQSAWKTLSTVLVYTKPIYIEEFHDSFTHIPHNRWDKNRKRKIPLMHWFRSIFT